MSWQDLCHCHPCKYEQPFWPFCIILYTFFVGRKDTTFSTNNNNKKQLFVGIIDWFHGINGTIFLSAPSFREESESWRAWRSLAKIRYSEKPQIHYLNLKSAYISLILGFLVILILWLSFLCSAYLSWPWHPIHKFLMDSRTCFIKKYVWVFNYPPSYLFSCIWAIG